MADAIALAGVAIGGGLPLTAAILRWCPGGNGKGAPIENAVTETLCQARQQTLSTKIDNLDEKIEAVEKNLADKIDELGQLIRKQA